MVQLIHLNIGVNRLVNQLIGLIVDRFTANFCLFLYIFHIQNPTILFDISEKPLNRLVRKSPNSSQAAMKVVKPLIVKIQ